MHDTEKLKEIPTNPSKKMVREEMYWRISTKHVKAVIQEAVMAHNKTLPENLQQSSQIHMLNRHHMKFIIDVLGVPQGYLPLNFKEENK